MAPTFDPGAAAAPGSGIFGLPHSAAEAAVHVLPVPFDATTSYRKGAARGPAAVLRASRQIDLYDLAFGRFYERGIHLLPADARIAGLEEEGCRLAQPVIDAGGDLAAAPGLAEKLERVNAIGAELNAIVRAGTDAILAAGKLPAVLGGDHAISFGAFQAAAERCPGLGLLHFDAHADLREAYEGFAWSHASILHNALERLDGIACLVQVGIRDLSEEEHAYLRGSKGRASALFDREWAEAKLAGEDLRALVRQTIARLPREVWVTFDVDGLDPTLCPGTGTPVPGGLTWHEAMLWLEELARSKKRVVGLDLVEVAPGYEPEGGDSWDAVVGARLLYKLIGAALASRP